MTNPDDLRLYRCPHGCDYLAALRPVRVPGAELQALDVEHEASCPLFVPDPEAGSDVLVIDAPLYDKELGWVDDVSEYLPE